MNWLDYAINGAAAIVAVISLAYTFVLQRSGARKAEIDALGIRIDGVVADLAQEKEDGQVSRAGVAQRLAQVELTLQQMPDKETVHKLALDVSEMRGDVRVQGEKLTSIGATAHRVENFLLETAKGKH